MHLRQSAASTSVQYLRYVFKGKVTVEAVEACDNTSVPVRAAVQICPVNDEAIGSALVEKDSTTVGEPAYAAGRWHLDEHDEICAVFIGHAAGDDLFFGFTFKEGWI